jgi:hypothetical protein
MRLREIAPRATGNHEPALMYCCLESGCLIRYMSSHGYMVFAENGNPIPSEVTPCVECPVDGCLMYLAEVRADKRSYRLWKCPECDMTKNNEEKLWQAVGTS